jgi:hypothetical protein
MSSSFDNQNVSVFTTTHPMIESSAISKAKIITKKSKPPRKAISDLTSDSKEASRLTQSEYTMRLVSRLREILSEFASNTISGGFVEVIPYEEAKLAVDSSSPVCFVQCTASSHILEFSPLLNSFQRMSLHALAGDLKLFIDQWEKKFGICKLPLYDLIM